MIRRRFRPGWPIVFLVVILVSLIGLFGRGTERRWDRLAGLSVSSILRPEPEGSSRIPIGPTSLDDPRLGTLREAAVSWRLATGPPRVVIDQVCLVPDVAAFFEAIAAWDEGHFFPILIDEPAWALPFLRAFRPARVVRYAGRQDRSASRWPEEPRSPAQRQALWQAALHAVARAWTGRVPKSGELPPGGAPPRWLGKTPPGLVLSTPDSPVLAAAVALAAGRFQPLVHLEPFAGTPEPAVNLGRGSRYREVLTLTHAWQFARRVEGRVAAVTPRYQQLGDDCDFLTIAGDWPYRYTNDAEEGPARGFHALDDLVGRVLVDGPTARGLNGSRRRWAYAGRLLGDPAASLAHAMAALFLRPGMALCWDTYGAKRPWSDYSLGPAADRLDRPSSGSDGVFHRGGERADLVSWHRVVDPMHRFGFIWINSSGGPDRFAIAGGPGRPADLPRGFPAAVVMIHSFSAADPADPRTIAGRWLAQGAFAYYGSVHEPFLLAFRTPGLVAELATAGIPLVAALRQGESEPLGRPWRLIYLGDPLYRLPDETSASQSPRLDPADWEILAPEFAGWPVVTVDSAGASPVPSPSIPSAGIDDKLLMGCRDAAIVASTARITGSESRSRAPTPSPPGATGPEDRDWLSVLRRIRRDRLDPRLRPIFDDLLIDALSESGAFDELQSRLAGIPPAERGLRVWLALETGATARLARLAQDPDTARAFAHALDLWDGVIRLDWPAGSGFPAQFIERVAAMAQADARRRLPSWHDRLRRALDDLAAPPRPSPYAAALAAEKARVEAQLGGHH